MSEARVENVEQAHLHPEPLPEEPSRIGIE
jgi:hypothetical protein